MDPSGLTLLGVVTIEADVRLGCRYQIIHFSFFVGVNTDALDRIAFRVGVIYLLQRLLRWLFKMAYIRTGRAQGLIFHKVPLGQS